MPYYVYILQSEKDGTYYIGSTQDLDERLKRHNEGRSKYTKTKLIDVNYIFPPATIKIPGLSLCCCANWVGPRKTNITA